jgi:hypothetical protein
MSAVHAAIGCEGERRLSFLDPEARPGGHVADMKDLPLGMRSCPVALHRTGIHWIGADRAAVPAVSSGEDLAEGGPGAVVDGRVDVADARP